MFRKIEKYRILVCGGDGTIGWVLQCLDNVGQDSLCSNPPCAIVPLGTGNDLARVLRWGSGYSGDEDPLALLRDVIEAEEIRLDRWTVVFRPQSEDTEGGSVMPNAQANEENAQIFVMNNYFGIGLDADLCYAFHTEREHKPHKFNSRLHNKGVYFKVGLQKMVGRGLNKDLSKEIYIEVDGKPVDLPSIKGIIILNIMRYIHIFFQKRNHVEINWFSCTVGDPEPIRGAKKKMTNSPNLTIGMVCLKWLVSLVSCIWVKFSLD